MRICLIGNSDSTHIQRWSKWFTSRGHHIYLITTGKKEIQNITTYHLKKTKNPINYLIRIIKTIRVIKKLKPDIVHAHYASGTESFAAALSGYHPFIVSAWGSDIAIDPNKSWLLKNEVKYVLRKADLVHVGDAHGKKRLEELGCNKDKILVVPWGVDLSLFNTKIKSSEKPSRYVVLCASPWYHERNPSLLLYAIPYVIESIKDIKFIFIGGGPLEEELKHLAKKLGIEDYVLFIGRIPHDDMPKYLSVSDILVDTDVIGDNAGAGIGVTNMEAMACGVPILLSERGYLKKIGKSLSDEPWYCSIVYEPRDPYDLGKKIIKLLKDNALREKIREQEINISNEIGDWKKNMEKIEQYIIKKVGYK